jgi:hypothetical protein
MLSGFFFSRLIPMAGRGFGFIFGNFGEISLEFEVSPILYQSRFVFRVFSDR